MSNLPSCHGGGGHAISHNTGFPPGLLYLGTPYSKYPDGTEQAFIDAAKVAAALLRAGVKVYSPIAHTHPIAIHGGIDHLDLGVWLPFDQAMMERCDGMLVAMMAGWRESSGVAHEIQFFAKAGKPVLHIDPAEWGL